MTRSRRKKRLQELTLTPEGWVFLIVLTFITVGAVLRNVNLLIVMAGMMYAPLLLNWRLGVRRLKSLRAKRRVRKQIHANELANIQWTCENQLDGLAAWNVVIDDRIERLDSHSSQSRPDQESDTWFNRWFGEIVRRLRRKPKQERFAEPKMGFVQIRGGQSEVQGYRVYFGNRGKYSIGPAAVSTTFPFGLIVSRTHIPKCETFHVAPEVGQLDPTWERRVQSTASGSEAIKRRRGLEEDEFYALRPFRSGDSKKNIHWRTTAKYGYPIVKQHDQQNNRDFALLLDLFVQADQPQLVERCETVLSFATTAILQLGHAVQGQIAIGICGAENQVNHSRSRVTLVNELMPRLAVVQGSPQPELKETLVRVAEYVSRSTPIYIISSRPQPATLDLDQLTTIENNSESEPGRRLARRLKQILPLIRWLDVESDEFKQMFRIPSDLERDSNLKQLSQRWANVKR